MPTVAKPAPAPPLPGAHAAKHKRPYRAIALLALVFGLATSTAVVSWKRRSQLPAPPPSANVHFASIGPGTVHPTIRLAGVTEAKNALSLLAPELSGSRTGRSRTASAGTAPAASSTASSSASASASTTFSSAPSASPAFRSATTRFGGGALRGSAAAAPAPAAAAPAPKATESLGAGGLGSTGAQLPGEAQGPSSAGADSEWRIVLQDVVPPGTPVKAGQVVAEFDRQSMLLRLDDYKASAAESAAALTAQRAGLDTIRKAHEEQIHSAQAALEKARLDMKTIPVLSAIAAENTRLAFDEAQARYEQLLKERPFLAASQDADIRNSEMDLEEANLELKRARENAGKMVVRTPMNGLAVMETTWRGGDFGKIQKGDEVWTGEPFMRIVDPSSMVVNATVNQVDVQRLRLGAPARIHFDAYPDLAMNAKVDRIGAMATETGDRGAYVREVPVRLRIEGRSERLTPDMSVSVDVEIEPPLAGGAVAPLAALFRDGSGGVFVFVKDDAGWIRRKVAVARKDHLAAVVSSGLQRGDVVALDWPPNAGHP